MAKALSALAGQRFKFRAARRARKLALDEGNHGAMLVQSRAMNMARWRAAKVKAPSTLTFNDTRRLTTCS